MTLSEEGILDLINRRLRSHGLASQGWTVEIVDSVQGKDLYGYTDFETKTIYLGRNHWPTSMRNIKELIYHEVAHALCGHGEHDLQWWDKLIDIGGRGVWVPDSGPKIKSIGVTVVY